MKLFVKASLLSVFVSSLFFATSASAGWVIVNEDGSTTPYTEDCCKTKVVKRVKKRKKAPATCATCDYSKFPMATLLPLEEGERLAPAKLGNCGMNK
jgi:hypothetical protein